MKLFFRTEKKRIVISKALSNTFLKGMTLLNPAEENGGILLGYKSKGDYIITNFLVCENKSKNKKRQFRVSYNEVTDYLVKITKNTSNKIKYLGEWHTHPSGKRQASGYDDINMRGRSSIIGESLLGIVTYQPSMENNQYTTSSANITFFLYRGGKRRDLGTVQIVKW